MIHRTEQERTIMQAKMELGTVEQEQGVGTVIDEGKVQIGRGRSLIVPWSWSRRFV